LSNLSDKSSSAFSERLLAAWALGLIAFLCTSVLFLSRVAGFHYDEAWAALFSHRIATEPGFWPLAAMSPYTSAWSHYFAALLFKILGTNLFVYRLSGILLVGAGVTLISLALKQLSQARAAAIFPWVMAFFTAAVTNERFVIEINTFHVFCLGLFCWGMSQKFSRTTFSPWISNAAVTIAIVFGLTSHILFLAPALACLTLLFWNETLLRSISARLLAAGVLLVFAAFALHIHLSIPEKDKSVFLLLIAAGGLMGVAFPRLSSWVTRYLQLRFMGPIRALLILASLPTLFFLLFFSEGSWAAAYFNGGHSDERLVLFPLIALAIGFAFSWRAFFFKRKEDPRLRTIFIWILLSWIITTALATKPAPRYFELSLVLLAALFSLALSWMPRKWAVLSFTVWTLSGSLQLAFDYFQPSLAGNIPEQSFRFLFFRDSSDDTINKQALAHFLADSGCGFDQVVSDDPRIMDPLRFLSIGDWKAGADVPKKAACRFGKKVNVERKAQFLPGSVDPNSSRFVMEFGPFILKSI
jgi:hypothetical protein